MINMDILQRIIGIEKHSNVDDALDAMYEYFDTLFDIQQFDQINTLLTLIDLRIYSTELLLGFLTVTLPVKNRLPYRKTFFQNVKSELQTRKDWSETLLIGLE